MKQEGPSARLSRVLWNGLEAVRIVATGLLPAMPETAPRVLAAIGVAEPPAARRRSPGAACRPRPAAGAGEPIFPRIDKEAYLEHAVPAEIAGRRTDRRDREPARPTGKARP
jgi:methionyl-tRNA synthetase